MIKPKCKDCNNQIKHTFIHKGKDGWGRDSEMEVEGETICKIGIRNCPDVSKCDGFSAKPKEKLTEDQKVKNRIVLAEGKKPRKGSQRTEAYKLSRVKVMKYMGKVPKV